MLLLRQKMAVAAAAEASTTTPVPTATVPDNRAVNTTQASRGRSSGAKMISKSLSRCYIKIISSIEVL